MSGPSDNGLAAIFGWPVVVAGLSLVGVPGTEGFVSQWSRVLAALERGGWGLAALVLASSLLALVYVWRVVEVCYFRAPSEKLHDVREAPLSMLVPAWLLVAACVFFGLYTSATVGTAAQAANALLESLR